MDIWMDGLGGLGSYVILKPPLFCFLLFCFWHHFVIHSCSMPTAFQQHFHNIPAAFVSTCLTFLHEAFRPAIQKRAPASKNEYRKSLQSTNPQNDAPEPPEISPRTHKILLVTSQASPQHSNTPAKRSLCPPRRMPLNRPYI